MRRVSDHGQHKYRNWRKMHAHREDVRCPSGKVLYVDKAEAKAVLRQARRRIKRSGPDYELSRERRAYRCPCCKCWHLTSWTLARFAADQDNHRGALGG